MKPKLTKTNINGCFFGCFTRVAQRCVAGYALVGNFKSYVMVISLLVVRV